MTLAILNSELQKTLSDFLNFPCGDIDLAKPRMKKSKLD